MRQQSNAMLVYETMLEYCYLDTQEQTLVQYFNLHIFIQENAFANGVHIFSASMS